MRRIKLLFSWLTVLVGLVIGVWALATVGMDWVDFSDLRLFSGGGIGLLGLVFTIGSLAALRNRKFAGVIFLALMPITAFLLVYPNLGSWVWNSGGGYFESPPLFTAIGLSALFFAAFFVLLVAFLYKKLGIVLFLISWSLVGTLLALSYWGKLLVPQLAEWAAPSAACGLFWLGTDKPTWPALITPHPRTLGRRVTAVATCCLLVFSLDVGVTIALSALSSSMSGPDCGRSRLFIHPVFPGHAVFTARAILVGPSLEALEYGGLRLAFGHSVRPRGVGEWAIAVVQERFWGLPAWWPRWVLLKRFVYWQGETYFIDGRRGYGLLARMLPIIEAGPCSRTHPVHAAVLDLSMLRKPPPTTGGRLVGFVRKPYDTVGWFSPPVPPHPCADANVRVTGPTGKRIVTTDRRGIYELDGLPSGDYRVQFLASDNPLLGLFEDQELPDKLQVKPGDVADASFFLIRTGRIQGRVRLGSGKPTHAWIGLISTDGQHRPLYSLQTHDDGSYRINGISAGRYVVMVSPYGPNGASPYEPQYYQGALRQNDAKELALAEGQEIDGVDFTVRPLRERTVQVRVTWPNGTAVPDAPVYFVYEHTADYQAPGNAASSTIRTNQSGEAAIHLFGDSHVRFFAAKEVDNPGEDGYRYFSPRLEAEVAKVPSKINMVLTYRLP